MALPCSSTLHPALFCTNLAYSADHRDDTIVSISPTVLREGPFRLFFFSREEPRMHVHVAHADGEAKFWLTPVVTPAVSEGLSAGQLRDAAAVVERHVEEIRDAPFRHFGR
jgi:Domain of unknown function (DUF4160)